MIIFTDEVIKSIKRDIASHAPERGGALLGPRHTNLVSLFLFDPQAKTTSASYSPSRALIEKVKQEELATSLTFKGIVHSHPNGMDRPSFADLTAFASNLAANSRMGSFIAPIISRGKARAEHEAKLGKGQKLSLFEAFRPKNHWQVQAVIEETPVSIMALDEASQILKESIETELDEPIKTGTDTQEINGLVHMTRTLEGESFRLDLFFPHSFPCAPPIALFSAKQDGVLLDAQELQFPWGISCFAQQALSQKLTAAIAQKTKEKAHDCN